MHQIIRWVDINSPVQHPGGLSPYDAYSSIQDAIDDADEGDSIVVMEGTYYENIHFNTYIASLRSVNARLTRTAGTS